MTTPGCWCSAVTTSTGADVVGSERDAVREAGLAGGDRCGRVAPLTLCCEHGRGHGHPVTQLQERVAAPGIGDDRGQQEVGLALRVARLRRHVTGSARARGRGRRRGRAPTAGGRAMRQSSPGSRVIQPSPRAQASRTRLDGSTRPYGEPYPTSCSGHCASLFVVRRSAPRSRACSSASARPGGVGRAPLHERVVQVGARAPPVVDDRDDSGSKQLVGDKRDVGERQGEPGAQRL